MFDIPRQFGLIGASMLRRVRFKCAMGIYRVLELPGTAGELIYERICPKIFSHGIRLVDTPKGIVGFSKKVEGTLDLISRTSPLFYKRVRNEISRIYHLPSWSGGFYKRSIKLCGIDLEKLLSGIEDENTALATIATTLVHEAAHGYLYSHCIMYGRTNHWRIEKICIKEANKFARIVGLQEYPFESYEYPSFRERLRVFIQDLPRIIKG